VKNLSKNIIDILNLFLFYILQAYLKALENLFSSKNIPKLILIDTMPS